MTLDDYLTSLKGKRALVTGASSGIGYTTACLLAENGCFVTAVARRKERLNFLKEKYPEFIKIIAGDITNSNFINELENKDAFNIDILINNAGLALGKNLFHLSEDQDIETMITTNLVSALKIAKRSLAFMKEQKQGDIVNVTSIASHEAYKGGTTYTATKHALLAASRSLREETHGENIRVISISPGMVETEFSEVRFKGDIEKAKATYQGFKPLKSEDIAFQILMALKCPRHVNLDEVIILATDQAGATRVKRES